MIFLVPCFFLLINVTRNDVGTWRFRHLEKKQCLQQQQYSQQSHSGLESLTHCEGCYAAGNLIVPPCMYMLWRGTCINSLCIDWLPASSIFARGLLLSLRCVYSNIPSNGSYFSLFLLFSSRLCIIFGPSYLHANFCI